MGIIAALLGAAAVICAIIGWLANGRADVLFFVAIFLLLGCIAFLLAGIMKRGRH